MTGIERKHLTQGDAVLVAAEQGTGITLCRSSPRMLGEIGVLVARVPNAQNADLHNVSYTPEQVKKMAERYRRELEG